MNVLVLHSELGVLRGGGENFSRNLFTAFAERGHRVAAAFVADHNGRYPLPLPSAIRPIPIPGWWRNSLGQATLSSVGRYLPFEGRYRKEWDHIQEAITWRVFRWHKGRFQRRIESKFSNRWEEFDAVYVHGDAILASKVARYRPTVLFLPGPLSFELAPELLATHAVCSNGDALRQIRSFLESHAAELPVGIDHRVFKPGPTSIRQRLRWSDHDRVVGYVGRFHHIKGVDILATAFREISRKLPDTRLLIVGHGGEEKNIRSDLAEEVSRGVAHIETDVDDEEIPEWYRAMDLMVMPSRYENFSIALLEGMACEKPFLGSDIGGNRMMAETGAGWLFESGSAASLVARLMEIIKNGSELKARGKIGFDYVQNHHSWSRAAERLEKIISSKLGAEK
jgi:glycosyltransferase involved in cell wall biosynthesis